MPTAVAFDTRGNVFVAGWQTSGSGKGLYVIKYDSLDGHAIWSRSINPSGTNEFIPNDIVVDSQGDCIVTGSRNITGSGIDYYTRKFNGATGVDGWAVGAVTFQGGNQGEDTALKVVVNSADDVIVTGRSSGVNLSDNPTGFDWVTIKYRRRVAFIGTLKGPSDVVKGSTNKIIAFGDPLANLEKVARTGDFATDAGGNQTSLKWTSFSALALPGGINAGPVFVAKLGTFKNNLGLWAMTSDGTVRQLLRQGDDYDGKTVKKFTLLNTAQKVMTAPRSFDAAGSVAVFLNFSDRTTAIHRSGIP